MYKIKKTYYFYQFVETNNVPRTVETFWLLCDAPGQKKKN